MSKTLFSDLIHCQAKKYGEKTALKHRDYETATWIPTSWNQFSEAVTKVSNSLIELGVEVQENIGVFTQNKPESLFVDFGAFGVRAVTIPFYATSSEAQVHYILEYAQIRYLFVGEQQQYDVAYRVMPLSQSLKQIIVFDRKVKFDANDHTTIYMDDFLALEKEFDNFHFHLALDRPDPKADAAGIKYTAGFVAPVMGDTYLKQHETPEDCEYYLCGPPMMAKTVLDLLDSLGVDKDMIHFDDFGG